MNTSVQVDNIEPHWPASLEIEFSVRPNKTVASKIKHFGPLRVQRPFYPEQDGCCHLYVLHPPGGVVGGDQLEISVSANAHSKSLVTTPGATKIYRSKKQSEIFQSLEIAQNAIMEWMPQETILFNQANTRLTTEIHFTKQSQLFFWDVLCLGLPANNEKFSDGLCHQSLKIFRDKKPILIERNTFVGGSDLMSATWGMRNFYINAVSVMTSEQIELVDKIRENVKSQDGCLFAVTKKQNLVICRYMGNSVDQAKNFFQAAWSVWRNVELEKAAVSPRIWKT